MAYYWDDHATWRRWLGFVVGCVAGALVVGTVWVAQQWLDEGDSSSGPQFRDAKAQVVGAEPSAIQTAGDQRLERCVEVYDAQAKPVKAARQSLSQWEVHIGAMNKLVTGAITLQQATAFWNDTRHAAAQRLKRFHEAEQAFGRRTARCPQAPVTDAALASCIDAVAARTRQLRALRITLATWSEHVDHMEMLRKGEMTPAEATTLWLASWRQGVQELKDYRAAARAARSQTCEAA